jgi:hypothetical protein
MEEEEDTGKVKHFVRIIRKVTLCDLLKLAIFGFPNRILRDTEKELLKPHTALKIPG